MEEKLKYDICKKILLRKRLFIRFLKEKKVYKDFITYYKKIPFLNELNGNIDNLINYSALRNDFTENELSLAFTWVNTKEGFYYWRAIYLEWKSIVIGISKETLQLVKNSLINFYDKSLYKELKPTIPLK